MQVAIIAFRRIATRYEKLAKRFLAISSSSFDLLIISQLTLKLAQGSGGRSVHTVMIVVGDNFFRKGKAFKVVKESEPNENGFLYSWAEGK